MYINYLKTNTAPNLNIIQNYNETSYNSNISNNISVWTRNKITSLENKEKNKYLKSLLLKEYLMNISIADRNEIYKYIAYYFENFKIYISHPNFFITPDKIKITFYYYSLYQNLYNKINK